jgi:hypothetical protein
MASLQTEPGTTLDAEDRAVLGDVTVGIDAELRLRLGLGRDRNHASDHSDEDYQGCDNKWKFLGSHFVLLKNFLELEYWSFKGWKEFSTKLPGKEIFLL